GLRPFPAHGLSLGRLGGGDALVDILLYGLGEFGLLARQLDHLRNRAVTGKGRLERLPAHSGAFGLGPQPAHEIGAAGLGGNGQGQPGRGGQDEEGSQETETGTGHVGPRDTRYEKVTKRAGGAAAGARIKELTHPIKMSLRQRSGAFTTRSARR